MKISASEVQEGDFLPGLDNGYVFEVEEGNGYLSYPATSGGINTAMPEDTILISFHDADGEENFLLANPNMELEVNRG